MTTCMASLSRGGKEGGLYLGHLGWGCAFLLQDTVEVLAMIDIE